MKKILKTICLGQAAFAQPEVILLEASTTRNVVLRSRFLARSVFRFPRALCSTRNNFVGGEHNPKCGFTLWLARSLARSVFRFPRALCSTRSNFVGGEPNPTRYVLFDLIIFLLSYRKWRPLLCRLRLPSTPACCINSSVKLELLSTVQLFNPAAPPLKLSRFLAPSHPLVSVTTTATTTTFNMPVITE